MAKKLSAKMYSLCEALADIAHGAGLQKFYSGDSRQDMALFIEWAQEFEEFYKKVEWGITPDMEYIDEIEKFTEEKIKSYKFYR
jgi:hypothetical protein